MKITPFVAGLAFLLCIGGAQATVIFDAKTGITQTGVNAVSYGSGGSPIGDSFTISRAGTIDSISVDLGVTSKTDGGQLLIYIVPDSAGKPSASGITLTNRTLLGSFLDSSLPQVTINAGSPNPDLQTETLSNLGFTLTAGRWWIQLVDANDPNNGNGSASTTSAFWGNNASVSGDPQGIGTIREFFSNNNGDNTIGVSPDQFGPYRLSVSATLPEAVPEPASFALFAVGFIGFAALRRRLSS